MLPGTLSVDDLAQRLIEFADDINEPGDDIYSNHGRVNVLRSIEQR